MSEAQLAEEPFDDVRVARLLRAPDGSLRVAVVNTATRVELGSVPILERTREGMERVMAAVAEVRQRIAAMKAAEAPAAPPPTVAERTRRKRPARSAPREPGVRTFADKVATLARLIRMDLEARIVSDPGSRAHQWASEYAASIGVEASRDYWYIRTDSARLYAVRVSDGAVMLPGPKGVQQFVMLNIDDMGLHDWGSRFRWPPKRAIPVEPPWVTSSLPSPELAVKRERKVTLRLADAPVRVSDEPAWIPREPMVQRGWRGRGWLGAKYKSGSDIKDVAAGVSKDIRDAIESGDLPDMTFSVRTGYATHTPEIKVEVQRVPGVIVVNPEWARHHVADRYDALNDGRVKRDTPAGEAILNNLRAIVVTYLRDDSDISTDYFNASFFHSEEFSRTLVNQQAWDLAELPRTKVRRDFYLAESLSDAINPNWPYGLVVREEPGGRVVEVVRNFPHGSGRAPEVVARSEPEPGVEFLPEVAMSLLRDARASFRPVPRLR